LYAMTHSDRFRAGVAGGAGDRLRNYDSIYTSVHERPADFPKVQELFSGELGGEFEGASAAGAGNGR